MIKRQRANTMPYYRVEILRWDEVIVQAEDEEDAKAKALEYRGAMVVSSARPRRLEEETEVLTS